MSSVDHMLYQLLSSQYWMRCTGSSLRMDEGRLTKKSDATIRQAGNGKTIIEDCVSIDVRKQNRTTSAERRLQREEERY